MALTKISSNLVADDAIVTGKIADGGVDTADLAANAVTTAKIAQNNVTAHHIADGSVTVTQLGADSVTNAKIADDAISEEHLDKTIISDLTEVTAVAGDFILLGDTSDSNNLKKAPISSILAGTLTTAAQTNITSLGTLTGLTVEAATARSYITSTGAGNNVALVLQADSADTTAEGGGVYYVADNTADSSYLALSGDNANYHLSVTHGGKVGIGTIDPQTTLDVTGTFAISNSTNSYWKFDRDDSDGRLKISDSSAEKFCIETDGKVGIGDTSPFAKLHVEDTGWSSGAPYGTVAYIQGGATNDANWGHLLVTQSGTTTDTGGRLAFGANGENPIAGIRAKYKGATYGDLAFSTRPSGGVNTERLVITSEGTVGIGTTDFTDMGSSSYKGLKVGGATLQDSGGGNGSATWLGNNAYVGSGNNFYFDGGGNASGMQLTGGDINFFTFDGSGGSADAQWSPVSRLHISETGTVGINTTSPDAMLEIVHSDPRIRLRDDTVGGASGGGGKIEFGGYHASASDGKRLWAEIHGLKNNSTGGDTHGDMMFKVNLGSSSTTEVGRFNFDGVFCVGGTTPASGDLASTKAIYLEAHESCMTIRNLTADSSANRVSIGFLDGYGTRRGYIHVGTDGSGMVTDSDYRLKENVTPMEKGLERLLKLKPVKYKWKESESYNEGFLAHEIQEAGWDCGQTVVGEKDAEAMQAIDYGRITPLLVKAIQEQQTIIEDLKARIETIEG